MNPEARQEALRRHGLGETEDGFELTLAGYQKASRRALILRDQGDPEAIQILALASSDPRRWEYARCLAIDAFTADVRQSGI
ncbi:hypothetical protein A4E84_29875 [Streptomyces qaidamensis]|uniref:Uncharacterized protein n=1 Tax=Streptomyces qaidamensis TaxID=1783515 RepID=A0A143C7B5_9ACTN|nr:hypothetical protein [Streptomyces qaidamensis]AMW13337.1 hypothetical protein A4E84_29875 [Streptomyces qaidamensis]